MAPHRGSAWRNAKRKNRRPLSSIILQEGIINSLVKDAREFIKSEAWYVKAGIPHRRGYLLHGPPGTGKSEFVSPFFFDMVDPIDLDLCLASTIYAVVSSYVINTSFNCLTMYF